MSILEQADAAVIEQNVEGLEVFTDFEQNNTYILKNENGGRLGMAEEENSGFLTKNLLQSHRPFEITVYGPDQQVLLTVERPFRFYFHTIDIFDENHRRIGSVSRQFSVVNTQFTVKNLVDNVEYNLFGPFYQPWTFHIKKNNNRDVGKITKEWSGMAKEMFTDEDQFGVHYITDVELHEKKIFLGTTFLIDFLCFEQGN